MAVPENQTRKRSPEILVVDDDVAILDAFVELLKLDGYETIIAHNAQEALDRLRTTSPAMIFMDIAMPSMTGLDALHLVREHHPGIPVVLITGQGSSQTAIKAMQLGAFEYLTKPLKGRIVRELARKVISSVTGPVVETKEQSQRLPDSLEARDELFGNSPPMQEVFKLIGSISATPNPTSVLILGESGTGKELVARSIHANSTNAQEPFVAINCTVLPENLLESELFGHERGAFTGASERKIGKFEFAKSGTIFLDEIGDISEDLQKKLLRVLQERQFERLGGNASIRVRARFVAATNRDLRTEVERGRFREDLFYRLNVVTIHLPPLRNRRGDIRLLAEYFLRKYGQRLGRTLRGFSGECLGMLEGMPWRGNVRELANLIERAVMLTRGDVVMPDALRGGWESEEGASGHPAGEGYDFGVAREEVINRFERSFLVRLLTDVRGNVSLAARTSRMTRQNFQRLMKKHQISGDEFRDR